MPLMTQLSPVAKPASAPVCGLTYPIVIVPLVEVLEPLISPQAASRSAAPSIAAPPPMVLSTSRRVTRRSNDKPGTAMFASPPLGIQNRQYTEYSFGTRPCQPPTKTCAATPGT